MRFACPKCQGEVRLSERACADCGLSLTLSGLIGHYGKGVIDWLRSYAFIPCPSCGRMAPITSIHCPHPDCGQKITVEGVLDKSTATPRKHIKGAASEVAGAAANAVRTVGDSRRRVRDFILHATPAQKRMVQWLFLLFCGAISAVLVLATIASYTPAHQPTAIWTLISLAVFTTLGAVIIPKPIIQGVSRYASAPVKLALLANYVTLSVVLYWIIGRWPGFILITWFLGGILAIILLAMMVRSLTFGSRSKPAPRRTYYDPSLPQGRRGRYD